MVLGRGLAPGVAHGAIAFAILAAASLVIKKTTVHTRLNSLTKLDSRRRGRNQFAGLLNEGTHFDGLGGLADLAVCQGFPDSVGALGRLDEMLGKCQRKARVLRLDFLGLFLGAAPRLIRLRSEHARVDRGLGWRQEYSRYRRIR